MKKRLLLLALMGVLALTVKAQYISPTDLMQLHKYFIMKDQRFAYDTNDYLHTVDQNWIGEKPAHEGQANVYLWFYYKDKKELQSSFAFMGGVYDAGTSNETKSVVYRFAGTRIWTEYLGQMQLMKAQNYGSNPLEGGNCTTYVVNNLMFRLIEYPPGVNGNESTYEVRLSTLDLK